MPLETHQASAIDQMKRMGQSTTDDEPTESLAVLPVEVLSEIQERD